MALQTNLIAMVEQRSAEERIAIAGRQKGMHELHLTGLQLSTVPPTIKKLSSSLKELFLAHNRIKVLPDEVCSLVSLEKLDLTDNRLQDLPPSIGDLRSLKYLHLGQNCLEELPHAIGHLKMLNWLDARYNKLVRLPNQALRTMPALTLVWLDGNPCCGPDGLEADTGTNWMYQGILGAGTPKLGLVQKKGS